MPFRVVSCRFGSYRAVSRRIVSFRFVSYRVGSRRGVSYRIMPLRVVSHRTVPFHFVAFNGRRQERMGKGGRKNASGFPCKDNRVDFPFSLQHTHHFQTFSLQAEAVGRDFRGGWELADASEEQQANAHAVSDNHRLRQKHSLTPPNRDTKNTTATVHLPV